MECRVGCGACCIVISISSPIPGMPKGKPAGVRCINLNAANLCTIFGKPERPEVCNNFMPAPDTCGETNEEAMQLLGLMESATSPTEDRNY